MENVFRKCYLASLITHSVKNLPAMQETQVLFLGEEDPLEKGMATHSSILAWRVPWTEEPGRLQIARVGHNLVTKPPPPPLGMDIAIGLSQFLEMSIIQN